MCCDFMLVQILKVDDNSGANPYAVRYVGGLADFWYDFRTKNSLKKYFEDKNFGSGDYLVIHENEYQGDRYVIDSVVTYRKKSSGNFLEMQKPGKAWVDLVRDAMDEVGDIPLHLEIKNAKKVNVPVVAM